VDLAEMARTVETVVRHRLAACLAEPGIPADRYLGGSALTGLLALAGLLVGFGTRMGGGCTSGHGVCGISRLSTRSLIATAMFMGSAALTVGLVRHVAGGLP
jgi:uncharacterized membrane protein YedE/YeeE